MSAAARPQEPAAAVLLEELRTASGHVLALATLNVERTLNALSLPMIGMLAPQLAAWNSRDDVVAVLLRGSGERAFCAGGDIQALYAAMVRNRAAGREVDDYPPRFLEAEYRLDHAIHRSRVPVVCLGHGVVMGGGLGLFSGARYRLVTERVRLAMPEVSIGLFPDAGASWVLKHLPVAVAAWLGMTGTPLQAADALHAGLATHAVPAAAAGRLVQGLLAAPWTGGAGDAGLIEACIAACGSPAPGAGALAAHEEALAAALAALPATAAETVARLWTLAGRDEWLDRGLATLRAGCPASVGIVHEQLRRVPALTLEECLRMEFDVATHCARGPDFLEGVRALIIDKDNRPAWHHASVQALSPADVAAYFASPWRRHPLADLGEH